MLATLLALSLLGAQDGTVTPKEVGAALASLPDLEPVAIYRRYIVPDGPFRGALRMGDQKGIHWYFGNLALLTVVGTNPELARGHLEAYLRNLGSINGARFLVADTLDAELKQKMSPDSHDAYAGTFLQLAVRYVRATGDHAWWDANANAIRNIARANIRNQIKRQDEPGIPGLTRAFQEGSTRLGTGEAQAKDGLLMDNCEVYAGLKGVADYLTERKDAGAAGYRTDANRVARGIHRLFDESVGAWRWSDRVEKAGDAWYPDLLCQVFPEMHEVPGTFAAKTAERYRRSWGHLTRSYANWFDAPDEEFPHLIVASFAAHRRKDLKRPMWSLQRWLTRVDPMANPHKVTNVADVGWAWTIKRILTEAAKQ